MSQIYQIKDYETRSALDVKKVGAVEYARHPSTRILCCSYRIGTKKDLLSQPIEHWSPGLRGVANQVSLRKFRQAAGNRDIKKVAHNAAFEQAVTEYVLPRHLFGQQSPEVRAEDYICTAAMASAMALPRKLEDACHVLRLPVQKDMEGHKLMLKMSKPRRATKYDTRPWHNKMSDLLRLIQYCDVDIDAETHLFLSLPMLNSFEQQIWILDQKINKRGFLADRQMVDTVLKMVGEEIQNLNLETERLTEGELYSTTQRDALLEYLERREGVSLPNIQAKTVEDAIETGLVVGKAKRLLEIRQGVSRTSLGKYPAFELRSRSDGRVRDGLMYWAASTGRWGGKGLQPHNFPRGDAIKDVDLACDVIKQGDLELCRLLYGDPLTLFSNCLRPVIMAPKGKELFCGDYAGIEFRVVFWLAGHDVGLEAIREKRDSYREMATHIFSVSLADVTDAQREVGKRAVLGCGFGMGWKKFGLTCEQFGGPVTNQVAKRAVAAYRKIHHPVPQLWYNIENAAKQAVKNPGKKYSINKTTWWVDDKYLYCQLPSGRLLSYYGPKIRHEETPWGEKRPVLYHWGVHPKTKKWVLQKTWGGTLVENIVQATARDVMAWNLPRLEKAKYELILTVHDEDIAERDFGKGNVQEFEKLMATNPPWSEGLPIQVKAWKGYRYKK